MVDVPTVRQLMTKAARTFRVDEPMGEAMRTLARSSFAAIPVIDNEDRLVGLLSEKDCLRTITQWAYERVAGGTVGDYMSPLEVAVTPEMDVLTAARAFLECNFACLPVTEDDKLVGRLVRHEVLNGIDRWASTIDKDRGNRLTKTSEHERPSTIEEIQKVASSHSRDQLSQIFRKH
ncbi:MAG: CBS domain-containing protein [Thermoanaerobaculales bacterium]